jgi:phosphoadenosine phosphosulfate reductase
MSLIENTFYGQVNKVDIAIMRIRNYASFAEQLTRKPYYVAYSGGKDSDCIRILCELAGVKYDLVHNHTTVDAPETVRYVRNIVKPENIIRPDISMWRLIVKKGFPPTRLSRYCCEYLKEQGGKDRFTITGVRWAESTGRKKNRGGIEVITSSKKTSLILNSDNHENRRLFESCQLKGKRVLNPIIDWSNADVWEFLNYYGCESNPLYQCGYTRIGCVGCPNSGAKGMLAEFERYPKYRDNYIRAFQHMVDAHGYTETSKNWTSGQATFDWWVQDTSHDRQIDGQLEFVRYN